VHQENAAHIVTNMSFGHVYSCNRTLKCELDAGTTKAAVNAWSLSKSLQLHKFDLPCALHEYNITQASLTCHRFEQPVNFQKTAAILNCHI
jgi:hypothetical protein